MSERYNDFKAQNAQIVAINSELSGEQQDFRRLRNIEYMFLSDPNVEAVRKYGVYNEQDPAKIFPSIFILDKTGVVRWLYIGKSATDRPTPDAILEALKAVP